MWNASPHLRYLGWLLGSMAPYAQYAVAPRKVKMKAQQLGPLLLSDKEKAAALTI